MANEFVARNGVIALNNSVISGSLAVTGVPEGIGSDHVIMYDTASGLLNFTASAAISREYAFLRNKTHENATDTISINQSIFNPSNLNVLSTSTFFVDQDADYYALGDLSNSGSLIVSGTLKIGGILYNSGSIVGPGIIE